MPEEIEVPVEQAQEHIHHQAQHSGVSWISQVALSSAIFAVLAAIAALFAGQYSNEAVFDQLKAANQWNYFQAKGVKSDILASKLELLGDLDKPVSDKDKDRQTALQAEKAKASEDARAFEESAERHIRVHEVLGRAVTFFQITIAIGAIAVLARKRRFFFVSLVAGACGIFFFLHGFLMAFGK